MKERKEGTAAVPPTKVVEIDQWNMEQISLEHNGMLMREDGSLVRTSQYETFLKNMDTQLKKTYSTTPIMPEELEKIPNHPQPSDMDLDWSHRGEWQEIPVDPNQEGSEQENCRVARVEPYINIDGKIKKALCYGEEAEYLKIWFYLEDIMKVYTKWKMSIPSKFFNNRKFSKAARRDLQENKKRGNNPPGDQSNKDIQGGRGGWRGRGRGYWRGGYQPYSSGIGRGRPAYDSERRENEYRDWDESQDPKGRDKESQGYYTKEYEEKKRARSPSRGERPNREDRDYYRRDYSTDRRRDSNRREPSPDRREYAPERRSRWDYSPDHASRRDRSRRENTPEKGRRYSGRER